MLSPSYLPPARQPVRPASPPLPSRPCPPATPSTFDDPRPLPCINACIHDPPASPLLVQRKILPAPAANLPRRKPGLLGRDLSALEPELDELELLAVDLPARGQARGRTETVSRLSFRARSREKGHGSRRRRTHWMRAGSLVGSARPFSSKWCTAGTSCARQIGSAVCQRSEVEEEGTDRRRG